MNRQERRGIWRFASKLPPIQSKYRLTLDEGNTSLKKVEDVFLKCEFENPTGSAKDRGIAYQISHLVEKGIKKAVISSSGNAAISAARYCQLIGIELTVFVSPKINKKKLASLEKLNCLIIRTKRPISESNQYAEKSKAYNLRPSEDYYATFGYQTIAYELIDQEPKVDVVFLPISSGTTLVGLAHGFSKLNKSISIHGVQTESVHPVTSQFDNNFHSQKTSLADAIVAKYTSRLEDETLKIIRDTHGWGWVISDEEIKKAQKWLSSYNILCSYEGGATIAAFWKARKSGFSYQYPVCLLTGKLY